MIIDDSYFTGDIYLPQVGDEASTVANNNGKLQSFIDEYEPKILEMALGFELYNEFKENLTEGGELEVGAQDKWSDLLNGTEYTSGSTSYKWRGLIKEDGIINTSLIAYYVYYWYVKDGITQKSTLGVVKPDGDNSKAVDSIPTLTNAWRKLMEWYSKTEQRSYFKGYVNGAYFEDYLGYDSSRNVSLYEFLSHNQSDYPNWSFTPLENKNSWGL